MTSSSLPLPFPAVGKKNVVAAFDGGDLTSDAGVLLLAQADRRLGLCARLASVLPDRRQAAKVKHPLITLLQERIYAIAQGYADANDLDRLAQDPALKVACGRAPRTGAALGSQPTISRLENGLRARDLLRMGEALATLVIEQLPSATRHVLIDLDPTEDPCHGQQELELFNGFYGTHCYLPLMIYVTGDDGRQRAVGAVLRPGNASTTKGACQVVRRLVALVRAHCPQAQITLRGDSGFGIDEVIRCCEALGLGYVLGLAKNEAVSRLAARPQFDAYYKARFPQAGEDPREYGSVSYQAKTWPHARRVVVKVEVTQGKLNPRFVVTNRPGPAAAVYAFYCQRGDPENRIKEWKVDLESGRTSCHRFLANQARLLLHTAAFVLVQLLQAALAGTRWATAQAGTVRTRLLKVGARFVETCRRICVHLPTACPEQEIWRILCQRLC